MTPHLSFYNLMAYDYAGSWDPHTAHQANLYPSTSNPASTPFSTSAAVSHYLDQGVRASQIVLGCPLYGRAFTGTKGPGEKYDGVGEGSWENGVWDFKALPREGAKEYVDREVGAGWSWDASRGTVVSYDSREVTGLKVEYVRGLGLGGVMWWESSGDRREGGLIETVCIGVYGRGSGSLYGRFADWCL
jgi:chitinase